MSDRGHEDGDDLDFVYSPNERLTDEQRIEILEFQVAELQKRISAISEQLPWLAVSHQN